MQHDQDSFETVGQHRDVLGGLAGFDVPISEIIPDEVVEFVIGFAEAVGSQICTHLLTDVVYPTEYPVVSSCVGFRFTGKFLRIADDAFYVASDVPQLVTKVTVGFDLAPAPVLVGTWCDGHDESHA